MFGWTAKNSDQNGAPIVQWDKNGEHWQHWELAD